MIQIPRVLSKEGLTIAAVDGFPLAADLFCPKKNAPRAVLIVNAATGVKRRYYDHYAAYMAEQSMAVLTYDYRGVGDSRPACLRGFDADFLDWGRRDFAGVVAFAKERWPDLPLLVVGHSIGGTILGMTKENCRIAAAVTVGAQTAYYQDWPVPHRWRLYLLWHGLLPLLTRWYGYFPGRKLGILEDLPAGIIRQWHARRLDPDFERQLTQRAGELYYDRLTCPVLAIALADDPIGSLRAVERLNRLFSRAPLELELIRPRELGESRIGHFGFFRPRLKATLWRRILEWLDEVLESRDPFGKY